MSCCWHGSLHIVGLHNCFFVAVLVVFYKKHMSEGLLLSWKMFGDAYSTQVGYYEDSIALEV